MKRLTISIAAVSLFFSLLFFAHQAYCVEFEDSCLKGEPYVKEIYLDKDYSYKIVADLGMNLSLDILQKSEDTPSDGVLMTITEFGTTHFRPPYTEYYILKITNSSDNVRTFNIIVEKE